MKDKQLIVSALQNECLTNRQIVERTSLPLDRVEFLTRKMVKEGELFVAGRAEVPKGAKGHKPAHIFGLDDGAGERINVLRRGFVPIQCPKQTWYSPLIER